MNGATLAITGEGRVDFQTAFGKTPSGVAAGSAGPGLKLPCACRAQASSGCSLK